MELLLSTPVANVKKSPEVRARERDIAALQLQLLRSKGRAQRQGLLDRIFLAETNLGALSTELFNRTRTGPRRPLALQLNARAQSAKPCQCTSGKSLCKAAMSTS